MGNTILRAKLIFCLVFLGILTRNRKKKQTQFEFLYRKCFGLDNIENQIGFR
jgi:hypothetical protein